MWVDSITPDDVRGRTRVGKLAPTNLAEAIRTAMAIKHPWYRCQALTMAAEHSTSRNQQLALLREAFDTAQLQEEINRAVTVSAWPLRVLAPLEPREAEKNLVALVAQANHEPHSLRRADALFALAGAVQSNETLLNLVVPSLTHALANGHGWRIDRIIRSTVELLKQRMPAVAHDLVALHSDNRKNKSSLHHLQSYEI